MMKPWFETLESRSLLSAAYPVVANDAGVLADNQHLSNDKAQLAADTASFKALITADKTNLKTTVAQDKSAVQAAKVAVKAQANNPTLLAPAQLTLENAIVKLSGDTAALQTRLSVDSADQRATLHTDGSALHLDQSLLKIDTQAANTALKTNAMKIAADLAGIQARGAAAPAVVSMLEGDLNAAARGLTRPAASAVASFANNVGIALNSGSLSPKQETALAQDLIDIVNSGGVGAAQTQSVIAAIGSLLQTGGASAPNTQACISSIAEIVSSVGGNVE